MHNGFTFLDLIVIQIDVGSNIMTNAALLQTSLLHLVSIFYGDS